jgi:molybdopterin/thiamine biosynthesis adenylyltransferase
VEETNLNRQLFFDSEDIGKYKVDVLKTKLKDANIIPFKKKVEDNQNLEGIVTGCDFLVNCADSPSIVETTRITDRYASQKNIPYCVAGGYNLHLGMVGPIIVPGKTKTFEDFIEYQKKNDPLKDLEKIKDIKQTGNLGPIAGTIANIQVMEIFKYLIGKGRINTNRFAEIDFMDLNVDWREF